MKYGKVAGVEKPVSRIGQGTIMVNPKELDAGFRLFDAAFAAGITVFDTAYVYGGGDNERCVGMWVRTRGIREKVVIIGKGGHPIKGRSTVTPADIAAQIRTSLDRFGFDYIDLYILHRDDPAVPVGEIVSFLNEHLKAGLIRAFGGSNWTYERLRAANEYAAANGLVPFAASSPNFSLAIQFKPVWAGCLSIAGPENEAARQWYAKTGLPIFSWSSIARGFFSGKLTRENYREPGIIEDCSREAFCHPENFERLDRAAALAREKGLSIPQVALAYVLNYPMNLFPLVGPLTAAELEANLAALEVVLSPQELEWLDGRRAMR